MNNHSVSLQANQGTPMPAGMAALRLHLRAQQPTRTNDDLARPMHAALHRALEQVDAGLSRRVHTEGAKSLTISPLWRDGTMSPRRGTILTGERLWVRITTLEREVLAGLLSALSRQWIEGESLVLDWHSFRIDAIIPENASGQWSSPLTTYGELVDSTEPATEITLRFVTPVSFRRQNDALAPTDPWRIFHSYLRRWQAFSDVPLEGVDEEAIRRWVTPGMPTGVRHTVRDLGFFQESGTMGALCFRITGDVEFQRNLGVLAQYANWCGTGARTAFGMGQTRSELIAQTVSDEYAG